MEISEDLIEQVRDVLKKHRRWEDWTGSQDPDRQRFPRCKECGHYWPCEESELELELRCKR